MTCEYLDEVRRLIEDKSIKPVDNHGLKNVLENLSGTLDQNTLNKMELHPELYYLGWVNKKLHLYILDKDIMINV